MKADLEKGAELWNQKLLNITYHNVQKANNAILLKYNNKKEQLQKKRKEKDECFLTNKRNIQFEEESKRIQSLKLINMKNRKVLLFSV